MERLSEVEVQSPEQFTEWWAQAWQVGEHVAVLAANGAGKTTLEHLLLTPRRYVLALDAKGYDQSLTDYGWPRTDQWPLRGELRSNLDAGEPVHVVLGNAVRTEREFAANNALMRRVLKDVFLIGRWTVLADEGLILAHQKFVGAGDSIDRLFVAARARGLSLVYGMQRTNIGRTSPAALSAHTQSTWVAVGRTRDERAMDRVAEICGRPAAEVRGLIQALPKFTFAVMGLDPFEPIRLVRPPKLPHREVVKASRW